MRIAFLFVLLAACSEALPPAFVLDSDGCIPVSSVDPEKPRLRYVDGQVSANDSCAIQLPNKLNPMIPPMYVNGAPIGFC